MPFKTLDQLQVLPPARVGQVPTVRVGSAGRKTDLSAYTFRLTAGPGELRSAYFHVRDEGRSLQFDGRGWGHGVGLCQWGARGQALAGRSTTQILQYYYRGCQLTAVR
jgi:stage II sporulation protein D